MAILSKGPGKGKNKQASTQKHYRSKDGQTVAAPGYKMGLIRNERDIKTPTKTITMGTGPMAVTRTQQQGIIGPKPVAPAQKVAAQPKKKSAVSKAVKSVGRAVGKVGEALTPDRTTFNLKAQRRRDGRGNRAGGVLKCFGY